MKRKLLITALLLFTFTTFAQNINLRDDYGLRVFDNKALSATHTLAQAKAAFPDYFKWTKFKGVSDADAMKANIVSAAWNQAIWGSNSFVAGNSVGAQPPSAMCMSRANIDASGIYQWSTNIPLTTAHGKYTGGGTGNYTSLTTANGGPGTTGGTQITMDHANWIDGFPRNIFLSSTWGDNSTYAYAESCIIEGFRLEGGGVKGKESAGIAMWDAGEGSSIRDVVANGFTYGIRSVRGTPSRMYNTSTFHNEKYGIYLEGGDLATTTIIDPSGDDNGIALTGGGAGFDRPGGGAVTIISSRAESRITGQKLFRGTGAFVLTIIGGQVYNSEDKGPVIDVDFQGYMGAVSVTNIRTIGTGSILAITRNGKRTVYDGPGSYIPVSFVCNESGMAWSTRTLTASGGGVVTPPDPCVYTSGTWSAWSECNNGEQVRTRTVTSTGDCTGVAAPAKTETKTCVVVGPPPPQTGKIDPSRVVVLINSADPSSKAMAAKYRQAHGIPASNEVTVNMGTSQEATAGQVNAARTAIAAANKDFTVLAMAYPSRISGQSITSAITFGVRSVTSLTVSPLYNYKGTTPLKDKAVRPSMILLSDRYIQAGGPINGTSYLLLAKDEGSAPRGNARAGQNAPNLVTYDNRKNPNIGPGENPCNVLSLDCWVGTQGDVKQVLAYYGSMYKMCCDTGVPWIRGHYGDHVTSWGGYLPDGNAGQTPLTWHLDRGASAAVGTVVEPWQSKSGNSAGSLAEQFTDVRIFDPAFRSGVPVGVAVWGAVKCPDRTLMAGDLMYQAQ